MKNKKTKFGCSFVDASSIGLYDERGYKTFTEFFGHGQNGDTFALSVYGPLDNGFWDSYWTSYSEIGMSLEGAAKDPSVEKIVLFINSPGGAVSGLRDICHHIKAVDAEKPVYAYITGSACSAAYAIASSARKVFSVLDGDTGCCGCYADPWDYDDEALKAEGFLHRVFRSKNAPKKNLSPVTDEEAANEFQAQIDAYGDSYLQLCADNRGVSLEDAEKTFGQGAVVTADYALANGMIDGICSLEEFFAKINATPTEPTPTLPEEAEGEGDKDMDIKEMSAEEIVSALSAEQLKGVFDAICTASPSLIEERENAAKEAENHRLEGLNALRNGSAEVDAVVDAAVADGRDANAIALDVISAMKVAKPVADASAIALEALVNATQDAPVPSSVNSGNPFLTAADELNNSKEE